jgi:ERCC4-type nuclease
MPRGPIPAELKPEQVTAIVDTREQFALDLTPLKADVGTLATGDYSVRGLEDYVAVERKSLEDLLGCIGRERERFEREIQRLLAYPQRLLVVESGWLAIDRGEWRAQVTPKQVKHSVLSWQARGLPIHFSYTHERAGQDVAAFLFLAARRRWREARGLITSVCESEGTHESEQTATPF